MNNNKLTETKLAMNIQFFAWDDVDSNGGGGKSDIEYTKINAGSMVTLRILDDEPFSRWTHWLPVQKRSLTCAGKDCPICAVIKSQKEAKETPTYSSTRRHILHVWNYDTNRIEFFEQGNTVFKDLSAFHKMLGGIKNADIKVMKTGQGKDTKYTFMPSGATPIPANILEEYNAKKISFTERYKAPDIEDMKKLMAGASFEDVYKQDDSASSNANTEEVKADNVDFTLA